MEAKKRKRQSPRLAAKRSQQNSLSDDAEAIEYVCRTCNIKVPHMFSKEHNTSEKHKTLKKLTEIIIDNNRNNIDVQDINNDVIDTNMFYCVTCCKAVQVENKSKHNRSSKHLKSIETNKLTKDFFKMYSGEDNDKSNDEYETIDDDVEEVIDNNNAGGQLNTLTSQSINNDFKTDLKTVVERYKQSNAPLMHEDSVIIVTPNGSLGEINADTFHDIAYCDSCYMFMYKERSLRQYYKYVNHNYVLIEKVKDAFKHCFLCRKPNSGPSDFCFTCRIFYNSSDLHDQTQSHQEYQQFKFWLSTKKNDALAHSNYNDENDDDDDSDSLTSERYSDYCKQFTPLGQSKSKCRVCLVDVPYYEDSIIKHVEGWRHSQSLRTLLKYHGISEISNVVVYYCNMCRTYTDNFMDHLEMNKYHKNWVRISPSIDKYKLRLYVYDESRRRDKEATFYQNMYEEMLIQNYITRRNEGGFFCKPCDIKLTKVSEIFHMFGERHREGLHRYLSPYKV